MLDRGRVVYLDRVESHWPLRLHLAPGSQVPIHCTASGKLFLATLPKTRRAALLRATPLDRHAPGTIVDPAALERELDALRKRDLGIDCEGSENGSLDLVGCIDRSAGVRLCCQRVVATMPKFPSATVLA